MTAPLSQADAAIISAAYAAEEKIRHIAQTRRPTEKERAIANKAFAAAAAVQRRTKEGK